MNICAVEELGTLVVFLSSNAAESITGAALPVNGGCTAHSGVRP
jgi:3-hydroxybutyrate dehydrogenase